MKRINCKIWCYGTSKNLNFSRPRWFSSNDFIFLKYYPNFISGFSGDDEHFEIVQSTNSFDVNGKEIYEGDVLTCKYFDVTGNWLFIGKVSYIQNEFRWILEPLNFCRSYPLNHEKFGEFEVICNAFETPDILNMSGVEIIKKFKL